MLRYPFGKNLIPEDDQYFRNTILEEKLSIGGAFFGTRYLDMVNVRGRWETYIGNPFLALEMNHPIVGKALQGSNVGKVELIPNVNYIRDIDIAIPHFRFVGKRSLATDGVDEMAATFIDEFGTSIVAHTLVEEQSHSLKLDASGDMVESETGWTRKSLVEDIKNRYGANGSVFHLANGSPIPNLIPINDADNERLIPVYKLEEDTATGTYKHTFEPLTYAQALEGRATNVRTIYPDTQLFGITMFHIPVMRSYEREFDYTNSPIGDINLFQNHTHPVWAGTIPYLTGKFVSKATAVVNGTLGLISAGDVYPGGIIYEELMGVRNYTYLYYAYTEDKHKLPFNGELLGVGQNGEFSPGASSFTALSCTNGTHLFTIAGSDLKWSLTPSGEGRIYTDPYQMFGIDSTTVTGERLYNGIEIMITDVKTGQCHKGMFGELVPASASKRTTASATILFGTGNPLPPRFGEGGVTITLVTPAKTINGQIDFSQKHFRQNKLAMTNTIAANLQGFDLLIRQYAPLIWTAFAKNNRKYTYKVNKPGTPLFAHIDFKDGTITIKKADGTTVTQAKPYNVVQFQIDLVNRSLLGSSFVRTDVFSAVKVSK